jgi:peptidoglycan hydrolase-like protein with peptidoglycan-binding domain
VSGEAIVRIISALNIFRVAVLGLALVGGGSVHARRAPPQSLSASAINQAACSDATVLRRTRAVMVKAEVLLDRLDLSPGVVDGKAGENAGKAIVAFQRSRGLAVSGGEILELKETINTMVDQLIARIQDIIKTDSRLVVAGRRGRIHRDDDRLIVRHRSDRRVSHRTADLPTDYDERRRP